MKIKDLRLSGIFILKWLVTACFIIAVTACGGSNGSGGSQQEQGTPNESPEGVIEGNESDFAYLQTEDFYYELTPRVTDVFDVTFIDEESDLVFIEQGTDEYHVYEDYRIGPLHFSNDYGDTWYQSSLEGLSPPSEFSSIHAQNQYKIMSVFCCRGTHTALSHYYISSNRGTTFDRILVDYGDVTSGPVTYQFIRILDDGTLLAFLREGDSFYSGSGFVFKSNDLGKTWVNVSDHLSSALQQFRSEAQTDNAFEFESIAVTSSQSQCNSNRLWVALLVTSRSADHKHYLVYTEDAAVSWQVYSADVSGNVVDNCIGKSVYIPGLRGITEIDDESGLVEQHFAPAYTNYFKVVQDSGNAYLISVDKLWKREAGEGEFRVISEDGTTDLWDYAIHPDNEDLIALTTRGSKKLLISNNGGLDWDDQSEGLSSFASIRPYFIEGNQQEIVLRVSTKVVETGDQKVYEKTIRYQFN